MIETRVYACSKWENAIFHRQSIHSGKTCSVLFIMLAWWIGPHTSWHHVTDSRYILCGLLFTFSHDRVWNTCLFKDHDWHIWQTKILRNHIDDHSHGRYLIFPCQIRSLAKFMQFCKRPVSPNTLIEAIYFEHKHCFYCISIFDFMLVYCLYYMA